MATTLQESLRSLIANGKTKQALDALKEQLDGTDEGNTITLLHSRWSSNQRSYNMGILSQNDYNMENNRINYALLSVIGDLEGNDAKKAVVKQVKEVINKIEVSGSGNIVNIGGVVSTGHINTGNSSIVNSVTGGIHIGDKIGGDKVGRDKIGGDKIKNIGTPPIQKESFGSVQKAKKTILFVAANPQGKSEASAGREKQTISDAITEGALREEFELKDSFATNVKGFLRLLKSCKPTIVHLSMHGGANNGVLFEDENGKTDYVTAEDLASFFELINGDGRIIECVILSACNSEEHAKEVNKYVDYVVGMQGPIPVTAAIEYTSGFYSSLLEGDDYSSAHKTAKILLKRYASKIQYDGDIAIPDIPKLFSINQK